MSIGPQMDVQRNSYGRPVWTSKRRKLALQWFLVGLERPLVVHIETSYKTGSLVLKLLVFLVESENVNVTGKWKFQLKG